MATVKRGISQRGGFWLDYARGADGEPASPNLYICWYDPARGRQRRKTTGESDVRIACARLDEHYLATLRPTESDRAVYDVPTAMVDYYLEHGSKQTSAAAIKARLTHVQRFIENEVTAGRMVDPVMSEAIDDGFLTRFREWAMRQPITARKKNERGHWVAGQSRQRSPATVEESVIQLKAAINHAYRARRMSYVPPIQHRTRDEVTPERHYRLSLDGLAELLDYTLTGAGNYGGHADRLIPLRRYSIGALCTIGRPDAVLDMSVAADREQWLRDERLFALNPRGRLQTRKQRPIMPVVDLLQAWLEATDDFLVCRERWRFDPEQQVNVMTQQRVAAVRSGWDSAKLAIGIPAGWGPKLLRHSMATILINRRVDLVELEIAMGHRVLSRTTGRYAIFDPSYLGTIRAGLEDVISDLQKRVGKALHPKLTQGHSNVVPLRA